jgi:hypothetical protein
MVILASSSSLFVVSYKGVGKTHYDQVEGMEKNQPQAQWIRMQV